jgi:hypothetical protein
MPSAKNEIVANLKNKQQTNKKSLTNKQQKMS